MKYNKSEVVTFFAVWIAVLLLGIPLLLLIIFKRVKILGRENLANLPSKNCLFIANHPSYIDPFLIITGGFMPKLLLNPKRYLPWQTPKIKHYSNPRFYFLRFFHAMPVEGYTDKVSGAWILRAVPEMLKTRSFMIFPEGTRSFKKKVWISTPSGVKIGEPMGGIAFIAYNTRPKIVPILVKGADKVVKPGSIFPNFLRSPVTIIFGKPFQLPEEYADEYATTKPPSKIRRKIAQYCMEKIAELDEV